MTAEIVGVVGNVLKDGNDRQPQPELYFVHGSPRPANQRTGEPRHPHDRRPVGAGAAGARARDGSSNPDAVVDRIEPLTTDRRRVARCAPVRGRRHVRLRGSRDAAGRRWALWRDVAQRVAAASRARDSCGARCAARRPRAPRAARRSVGDARRHRAGRARRQACSRASCRICCSASRQLDPVAFTAGASRFSSWRLWPHASAPPGARRRRTLRRRFAPERLEVGCGPGASGGKSQSQDLQRAASRPVASADVDVSR